MPKLTENFASEKGQVVWCVQEYIVARRKIGWVIGGLVILSQEYGLMWKGSYSKICKLENDTIIFALLKGP